MAEARPRSAVGNQTATRRLLAGNDGASAAPEPEPQAEQRGERGAAGAEPGDDGLGHREHRPAEQAPAVDAPRARAIEQPAAGNLQRDVGPGERREQVAQGDRVQPQVARQVGADDRQRRPIGVVDRRDEEQDQDDQVARPGRLVGRRRAGVAGGGRSGLGLHAVFLHDCGELASSLLKEMSTPLPLSAVCRLPAPDDNVAIAIRRLDAGTRIEIDGEVRTLASCVLEGHRFAVRPIAPGEALLSWGLPFGHALRPDRARRLRLQRLDARGAGDAAARRAAAGEAELRGLPGAVRARRGDLPARPAGRPRRAEPRTFRGYRRPGGRGVGTRNTIVILGTTSRTASFARQLAARLQSLARRIPALDGIVAVAHTEGGGPGEPNNAAEVLRALAGFMVHPNVGAVLALDLRRRADHQRAAAAFMREHGLPARRRAARVPQRRRRPRGRPGGRRSRSCAAGCRRRRPQRPHARSRSRACASRCSAAARMRSPASPATRSPAPSCTS